MRFDRIVTPEERGRTYRFFVLLLGMVLCFGIAAADWCYTSYQNAIIFYFEVQGNSMAPTLLDGQQIAATDRFRTLRRGDIVIFSPERYNGEADAVPYVKSVVAVAGDIVFQTGTEIHVVKGGRVDGVRPQGVVIISDFRGSLHGSFNGPVITEVQVKTGEVFVLGDNYNDSTDSSLFGPILLKDIRYLVRGVRSRYYEDLK